MLDYIHSYSFIPYGSKHCLRRYLAPQIIPQSHFLRKYGWIHRDTYYFYSATLSNENPINSFHVVKRLHWNMCCR